VKAVVAHLMIGSQHYPISADEKHWKLGTGQDSKGESSKCVSVIKVHNTVHNNLITDVV
jgi:hypothetical protein